MAPTDSLTSARERWLAAYPCFFARAPGVAGAPGAAESLVPSDDILAFIMTEYKLSVDDAYAAVSMLRGMNKMGFLEYVAEPWCQPLADLRRFVGAGLARSALPPGWDAATTELLMDRPCLLGYGLPGNLIGLSPGCADPIDLLKLDPTKNLLRDVRELGDRMEGPPPWGTAGRGPRDHVEARKPLQGRNDGGIICPLAARPS